MPDQPSPPGVAAELDRTEHAVLCLLMDPDAPDLWSVAEVAHAIGNEIEALDALVTGRSSAAPRPRATLGYQFGDPLVDLGTEP